MGLDFVTILIGAVSLYVAQAPASARTTFVAAALLGTATGIGCFYSTRLFNRRFYARFLHWSLSCVAALTMMVFVIAYPVLGHFGDAADLSIQVWEQALASDQTWASATFRTAYAAVRALGLEDFSYGDVAGTPGAFIPTAHDESRERAADVYAAAACANLALTRPLLNRLVWTTPAVPAEVLYADVRRWHATSPDYPPSRAIALVGEVVRGRLAGQITQLVSTLRLIAFVAFILGEGIAFGVLNWAAYRDIKVKT